MLPLDEEELYNLAVSMQPQNLKDVYESVYENVKDRTEYSLLSVNMLCQFLLRYNKSLEYSLLKKFAQSDDFIDMTIGVPSRKDIYEHRCGINLLLRDMCRNSACVKRLSQKSRLKKLMLLSLETLRHDVPDPPDIQIKVSCRAATWHTLSILTTSGYKHFQELFRSDREVLQVAKDLVPFGRTYMMTTDTNEPTFNFAFSYMCLLYELCCETILEKGSNAAKAEEILSTFMQKDLILNILNRISAFNLMDHKPKDAAHILFRYSQMLDVLLHCLVPPPKGIRKQVRNTATAISNLIRSLLARNIPPIELEQLAKVFQLLTEHWKVLNEKTREQRLETLAADRFKANIGVTRLKDRLKKNEKDITRLCFECQKAISATATLKKCSRCKIAAYCNKNCQKKHWKVHKLSCAPPVRIKSDDQRLAKEFVKDQQERLKEDVKKMNNMNQCPES